MSFVQKHRSQACRLSIYASSRKTTADTRRRNLRERPDHLSELTTLDPCCGSGHFLVFALHMLVPMRMEMENLTAQEACDRVLSENLHGLELDQRCVALAAFALALAAWKFPDAGGYRSLPELRTSLVPAYPSVPLRRNGRTVR